MSDAPTIPADRAEPARGIYPTAYEVARVIVEAARVAGENPIWVAEGRPQSRARVYAFGILAHRFRHIHHEAVMRMIGIAAGKEKSAVVGALQILREHAGHDRLWFRFDDLNVVALACGWPEMTRAQAQIYRLSEKKRSPPKRRETVKELRDGALTAGPDCTYQQRWVKRAAPMPVDPETKKAAIAAYATGEISREEMMRRITPEKAK